MSTHYNMIDLFAGTGAFSLVFGEKFNVVYSNDFDENSKLIYDTNFRRKHKVALECSNIFDIDVNALPKHYLLTAGFQCQPFSIAGKQMGFNDERANVFYKLIEIIKKKKPEIVILENVKNLKSHDNGNTFTIIINELKKLKYYVKYDILNTCKITNIPQNRERIYIVCFKNKELCDQFEFDFPETTPKKISQLLENEKNIDKKYYYSDKVKIWGKLKNDVIKKNTIYQYRRYYVRENKKNVCPTLTANMGTGGHNVPIILDNNGIRKLTPRECFNFQGFPKIYKLPKINNSKLYKLAGNAVSVPVVQLIAKKIYELLNIP